VIIDIDAMYNFENLPEISNIVWTKSMKRLYTLVGKCLQYKEPVLLVGETGTGKTTICQLFSIIMNQKLHIINCHQHTETSDFLGGLRPVRSMYFLILLALIYYLR
jgi:midasin